MTALLLFMLIFLSAPAATAAGPDSPASDAAVLGKLYVESGAEMLAEAECVTDRAVLFETAGFIRPSGSARLDMEARITAMGGRIADDAASADVTVRLSILDARVVIEESGDAWKRTCALTIRLTCTGSWDELVYTGRREPVAVDMIGRKDLSRTDDARDFAHGAVRTVIRDKGLGFKIASFALITGVIAFFAFR